MKQHKDKNSSRFLFHFRGNSSSRSSEEELFTQMINRNRDTIFNVCAIFSGGSSDNIQDMFQDIACKLWETWPRLRNKSSTDLWVRRVALNVALSSMRKRSHRPQFVRLEEWMCNSVAEEVNNAPPDYREFLEILDSDSLALLFLRREGQSIRDIAETLDITEEAVKQRLYRIRKKIDSYKKSQDEKEI